MKNKTPTLEEKVKQYEDFLHNINLMLVTGDSDGISELILNADKWSYMHRCGETIVSEEERQELIDYAFWNLCSTPKTDKLVKERQARYLELNR
jgi:hypothetical protein